MAVDISNVAAGKKRDINVRRCAAILHFSKAFKPGVSPYYRPRLLRLLLLHPLLLMLPPLPRRPPIHVCTRTAAVEHWQGDVP